VTGRPPQVPRSASEHSRRALISVVSEILAAHWDALTLVGAHAVMLRTEGLALSQGATGDGDLGITPQLTSDVPAIGELMGAAGFEARSPVRPGLWGRGKRTLPDGRIVFDEQIDLITGSGLAGKLRSQQRSVPNLIDSHGKMSVGNSPGLELAAYDRNVMVLVDLVDPNRTAEVNVAGLAALMCAKAFKLGERLADGGRRLRDKDAGDLLRLMKSSVPAGIAATLDTYAEHELIGASVIAGRAYLVKVLASPVIRQMAKNSYEGEIDPIEVETDFELCAAVFTTS
jgi:hypothetical protein